MIRRAARTLGGMNTRSMYRNVGRAYGRALPSTSRRGRIIRGSTPRGKRVRQVGGAFMGGALGTNAVLGQRPPSSGVNGLQGRSSGGRGLY